MSEPFVSIIMPVRNEEKFIQKAIQSVLNQNYPKDKMEILVAEGMSEDQTRDLAAVFQDQIRLIILENPEKIVSTGLNRAIQVAKGEIVLRVDGHCELGPEHIRKSVEYLKQENVAAVGGPIETLGETRMAQSIALAMSSFFGVGGSAFRTQMNREQFADTVPFPAFRKKTLEDVGPFDEELVRNQDDEYSYRMRKKGLKLLLAPDLKSKYYSRSSLKSLWKQYFEYGFWKVRVAQKHSAQMQMRQWVPFIFVFSLIDSFLLGLFFPVFKVFFGGLFSFYLMANFGASLKLSFTKGVDHLIRLPFVFGAIHFSYGLGFGLGILKFGIHGDAREKGAHGSRA